MRQKRLVSVRMRGVGIRVWGFWATAQDGAHGVRMWLLTGRQCVRQAVWLQRFARMPATKERPRRAHCAITGTMNLATSLRVCV
ncbi:hypothetical protein AB6Q20_003941 [Salmonella enterica]